jgi:hypothetical protein
LSFFEFLVKFRAGGSCGALLDFIPVNANGRALVAFFEAERGANIHLILQFLPLHLIQQLVNDAL